MSLLPKTLNPSGIIHFENCEFQWLCVKLGVVANVVDKSTAIYGKSVHNIIVIYFGSIPSKPTESQIEKRAKDAFEDGKTAVMSKYGKRNKQILKNFIAFEKHRLKTWKQYKPTFTERMLQGKLFADLPPFRCITDAYWEKDQAIVDWKSGKTEMTDDLMIQGKINELLAIHNNFPVKKVIFAGLWSGRTLTLPPTSKGWVYRHARQMVDQINTRRFPKRRSGLCPYCPYHLRCLFDGKKLLWDGI